MKKFVLLTIITFALWVFDLWLICFYIPSDSTQGVAQRIFYFHVPTAWVSFIAFTLSFYYSIQYLRKRELSFDLKASSFAFVGWVFTSGVLITGPLWAKPIWGTFWNWSDQRLISFFILWISFVGYLLLRRSILDIDRKARLSSILNIIAFFDVPLVYLSIRIWNTPSHPAPIVGGDRATGLPNPEMRFVLYFSFLCFILLMVLLYKITVRLNEREYLLKEKLQ